MTLTTHVTSLETSKKLEALGVPQEGLFYWATFRNESSPKDQWHNVYNVIISEEEIDDYEEREYLKDLNFHSAWLASELGEMLPGVIEKDGTEYYRQEWKHDHEEPCFYSLYSPGEFKYPNITIYDQDNDKRLAFVEEKSEPEMRGKLLIFLLENRLIPLPKTP